MASVVVMILAGCAQNPEAIEGSRRDAIVDSIVAGRMGEITRLAGEDLDRRRSIEVKAKADSILLTRQGMNENATPDNTATGTQIP